jgi:Mor family transcriptional regulator
MTRDDGNRQHRRGERGWREAAPPLLVELADHAADVLRTDLGFDPERADYAGYLIMRRVAEVMGGTSIYLPRATSLWRHERDEAIWRDWTAGPVSVPELARRYGTTTVHIYRIIHRLRAEEAQRARDANDHR